MTGPGPDPGPQRRAGRVTCGTCAAQPPDQSPGELATAVLTRFADQLCPLGGVGCPHTTTARVEVNDRRPGQLLQLLRAARDRLTAVEQRLQVIEERRWRARRVPIPALAAGAWVELAVGWPQPLPDDTYQVAIAVELAAPVLLGRVEAALLAGSRTPTGCTVLAVASRDVAESQAGVHVVAIP